jgi:hypothetical protein
VRGLEEVPENVNWGHESVSEVKKVPIEVVREPVGNIVLNNSGTHQNVLVLFLIIKIRWKSSTFVLKNSGTHQNVLVLFLKILD